MSNQVASNTAEIADRTIAALASDALDPVFCPPELLGKASAWWLHVPFAFWLMSACKPRTFVELGTHNGVSYSAFCEANARERVGARCFAIDTWQGDEHAGFYDDSVFLALNAFNEGRYNSFSTLIRATFHEAVDHFADGSIDLLHIDGRHRYEDVKTDYEEWLPKLSDRAVVLFHDTNVREKGFGVYRFFHEIAERYPSFEMLHGYGLGLIALGDNAPLPIKSLCAITDGSSTGRIADRFAQLGSHWLALTRESLNHVEFASKHAKTQALFDRSLRRIVDMRHTIESLGNEIDSLRKLIGNFTNQYAAMVDAQSRVEGVSEEGHQIRRSIYFDADWYRLTYPDVAEAGMDPVTHYLEHGAAEGREPGPVFSGSQYLKNNPDVAAAGANPLLHYCQHGRDENRSFQATVLKASAVRPPPALAGTDTSILYISGEPDTPGHRYRVLRYIEAALANGVKADFIRADKLEEENAKLDAFGILIIWRVPLNDFLQAAIERFKSKGGTVVFDVDDLMVDPGLARFDVIDGIRTQSLTEAQTRAHYERVTRTMFEADFCVATTQELAYHMRKVGKSTFVLPNGFDQSTLDRSRAAAYDWNANKDEFIRMGYAGGSRTHQRDFGLAVDAIGTILHENKICRLVLFRTSTGHPLIDVNEYPALQPVLDQIEWRLLQPLEALPNEMARFDINLAPLEFGNPFCEAKSELKFFEAALVGVPTIASPTGPFCRAIDHGRTGLLAASADDWLNALRQLVADPQLRCTMAHAANIASLANFGPRQRALQMGRLIEQLHRGSRASRGFALDSHLNSRRWERPAVYPSDVIFEGGKGGLASVAIVVPLYNYESLVTETLKSVASQTLENLELVIVDGCSTDGSLGVARDWATKNAERFSRIVVLRNQDNYGLAMCRNSGFDAATAPYVLPLDADNRLLADCADELLAAIRASGAAYVYPTLHKFGGADGVHSGFLYEPQRLVAGNYIDATALVAKETWAIAGGYHHVPHGLEDYDFWCRLAEIGLAGEWHPKYLVDYRVHEKSITKKVLTSENYVDLLTDFEVRHPWVSLIERRIKRATPPLARRLTSNLERLDVLLPILRCPLTHQRLAYTLDRKELITVDGARRWPIVDGRPGLISGISAFEVKPKEQISNEVPDAALAIIRETKGRVLNLSAGGSHEKFDHVVEVEFAVFRHTDVLADAHRLPFDDECFDAVIAMNAFEHYRDPAVAAAEIMRVLKPGGRLHIRTAFLQPLHEKPWHFFNCTRYGMAEWFKAFEHDRLDVSPNFCPNHSIAWLASECEAALRADVSASSAEAFANATLKEIIELWRDPTKRETALWKDFEKISQEKQEITAAGFELIGRKPDTRSEGALRFRLPS